MSEHFITRYEVRLIKTCEACPEQYNAYNGDNIVGYLRLRHGWFSVTCPDVGGTEVYSAPTYGDGMFEEREREFHLQRAVTEIRNWLEGQNGRPGDLST